MKWSVFCRKPPVCKQCGVYFEPRKPYHAGGEDDRWPDLCNEHRAPYKLAYERSSRVVQWARDNWEKLEEQMKVEEEAKRKAYEANRVHEFDQMRMHAQANAQQQAYPGYGFMGSGLNRYW